MQVSMLIHLPVLSNYSCVFKQKMRNCTRKRGNVGWKMIGCSCVANQENILNYFREKAVNPITSKRKQQKGGIYSVRKKVPMTRAMVQWYIY